MLNSHILLIDDHALFRSGLRMIIESRFEGVQVLEAGSLEQALGPDVRRPAVVLLDIRLPGLNGLESIAVLKRRWQDVPIVMLSSDASNTTVRQALERGAAAFVSKADKPDAIAAALQACLASHDVPGASVPGGMPCAPAADKPQSELTPRQCEVLALLGQGLPNKSIARKLDISENTIRGHVQSLLVALGANTRSEAVYIARRQGLLD
jgi:DNA-binding NarL/FixJ family response regulator